MIAKSGETAPSRRRWAIAGASRRRVRSPEAPKMTSVNGGRISSSALGSRSDAASGSIRGGNAMTALMLGSLPSFQDLRDGAVELFESRGHVCPEVHIRRAPSPGLERREIPRRLRRDDAGEAPRFSGNHDVLPRLGGDLEENPARRTALVELPRRVQEPGAEADGRRDSLAVPHAQS